MDAFLNLFKKNRSEPDPLDADIRAPFDNFLLDERVGKGSSFTPARAAASKSFQLLEALSGEQKIQILLQAARQQIDAKRSPENSQVLFRQIYILERFLTQHLPFSPEQFIELFRLLNELPDELYHLPVQGICDTVENYLKAHGIFSEAQVRILTRFYELWKLDARPYHKSQLNQFGKILLSNSTIPAMQLRANGEIFAGAVVLYFNELPLPQQRRWAELILHAQDSSPSKPSGKWCKQSKDLIESIGQELFLQKLIEWLPLADKPAPEDRVRHYRNYGYPLHPLEMEDAHVDALKGLAWMAGLLDDDALTRAIGLVGVSAYKKIPGVGPRAVRLGNACVWALGNIGSQCALSQLAMMKVRVKNGMAQKALEKALQKLADAIGVSTEELQEMSVPSYGLTDVGRLEEKLGEFTAVLEVVGNKPVLSFLKPDGAPQKSVPAAVKENFSDDLKEIKGSAKDLEKMLMAQKERLDNLFLLHKSWPLALWEERYLNHPVVGVFARRLIWRFQAESTGGTVNAIWYEGALTGLDGKLADLPADTTVTLWHPIESDTEEIIRWRNWLFEHLVQQPFKQAHREIYLLTDAERTTDVYSNRFASHVLKQHQFNSLCAVRGWKNKLRLMVDDEYPPAFKLLPAWGLRAEYWIEGMGDDYTEAYVTESGAFRYLITDQVRFYRIDDTQVSAHAGGGGYGAGWRGDAGEPLKLDAIPPIVLSEILRDVDLFVGVTSVGNDPNWFDGGPEGRHRTYWHDYSFGDLGETAVMRQQLLEKLLPKLKIAKQCRMDNRFLIVEGKVRTYKIHLGSGNILMEPNDQYLCIVKAPSRGEKESELFLPFEGDGKLATILSKAFLLAADDKIKDSTILSQIGRK